MAHDWKNKPIGNDPKGNPVMLKDIWFDNEELRAV
jgi:aconitase A